MAIDRDVAARLRLFDGMTYADVAAGSERLADAVRAFSAPVGGYRSPAVEVGEERLPGPHGDVRVRLYRPPSQRSDPGAGLVWVHGGGFRGGDLDMPEADAVAREVCAQAAATVVSVEYRLAVDGVHYPVPLDDVVAAWLGVVERCAPLGINAGRLALGGASAGGNLAAGATLRLRDAGGPLPSRLILAYPLLHRRLPPAADPLPADVERLPPVMRFPPSALAEMTANYLGSNAPDAYAFPALGTFDRFPATTIVTSEYDDLRVSGEAFAARLRAAGVAVSLRREPGVPHGHLNVPGLSGWRRSVRAISAETAARPPR